MEVDYCERQNQNQVDVVNDYQLPDAKRNAELGSNIKLSEIEPCVIR